MLNRSSNPWISISQIAILAVSVVLLLQLAFIVWDSFELGGVAVDQGNLDLESQIQIDAMAPIDDFTETIERTIFSWNRTPAPREGLVAPTSKAKAQSEWQLAGLVNTGISTYAIFSKAEGDQRLRLEQGMELDGWMLESIGVSEVTVIKGDERRTYRLNGAESSAADSQEDTLSDSSPSSSNDEASDG